MNFVRNLIAEPWRFDYFALLRQLERTFKDRPRIGDSAALREEFAKLGQDPFMEFPASNVARVKQDGDNAPLKIFVRHLGLLGPQGALPLAATEEAYHYVLAGTTRFRAFSICSTTASFNCSFGPGRIPARSRSTTGLTPTASSPISARRSGSARALTRISTLCRTPQSSALPACMGPQAKSASRLAAAIQRAVQRQGRGRGVRRLAPGHRSAEWTRLGRGYNVLGEDALLGRSIFSVQDKIRIRIFTRDLAQYIRFLPTGDLCEPMADLVFFYSGEQLEYDAELAIPAGAAEPIRLGRFGQLGWTTWMAPNWTSDEAYRRDARFHPAERMRHKRKRAQHETDKEGRGDGRH